jgi:hypothetical protein
MAASISISVSDDSLPADVEGPGKLRACRAGWRSRSPMWPVPRQLDGSPWMAACHPGRRRAFPASPPGVLLPQHMGVRDVHDLARATRRTNQETREATHIAS